MTTIDKTQFGPWAAVTGHHRASAESSPAGCGFGHPPRARGPTEALLNEIGMN